MGKKNARVVSNRRRHFISLLRENIPKMERKVKFAAGEMESFQSCSRPVGPHNWIRGGGEKRRWRRGGGSLGSEGNRTLKHGRALEASEEEKAAAKTTRMRI